MGNADNGSESRTAPKRRLARYQQFLLVMLVIVTLAWTAVVLTPIVQWVRSSRGSRSVPQERIALAIETPPAQPTPAATEPGVLPSPVPTGSAFAVRADGPPSVDWQEDDKLRHAASLLLLHHEYDAAVELLLQEKANDAYAFALDKLTYGKLMRVFDALYAEEFQHVRGYYEFLPREARARWFGKDESDKQARLEALLGETGGVPELHRLGAALPERALMAFMGNLHVELAQSTAAPPELISLLLDAGFPQESLMKAVYRSRPPESRVEYAALGAPANPPGEGE